MAQLMQRLLACVLMSAAVTGGAAIYGSNQLSRIDPADVPGLAAFIEMVPDAVQWQYVTIRTNNVLFAEFLNDAVEFEPTEEWSESFHVRAYDAAGNLRGEYFPPEDETDESFARVNDFDREGNLIRVVGYRDGQTLTETQITYDEAGRRLSETAWRDGEKTYSANYTYTPQPDGTLLCSITCWTQNGQLTESSYLTNSTGQFLMREEDGSHITLTYDHKERPTSHLVSKDNRTLLLLNYSYTDALDGSYLCRYERYENGNLTSRAEQQFDAFGVCVHQVEYNAAGEMFSETTAELFTP